ESDGALLTKAAPGLLRWPVAADPPAGRRRYGPPQLIAPVTAAVSQHCSAQGGVVAIPAFQLGAVVWQREGKRTLRLGPQEDVRYCAVSPDGRWVATGSHWLHKGPGAKVWDTQTGQLVQDLPVGHICSVRFSPNGKWLLTSSGGPRLWEVGTWREGPALHGDVLNASGAFTADGKLLALGDAPGVVRLLRPDSGQEI